MRYVYTWLLGIALSGVVIYGVVSWATWFDDYQADLRRSKGVEINSLVDERDIEVNKFSYEGKTYLVIKDPGTGLAVIEHKDDN
jgi:hypothetical protein